MGLESYGVGVMGLVLGFLCLAKLVFLEVRRLKRWLWSQRKKYEYAALADI